MFSLFATFTVLLAAHAAEPLCTPAPQPIAPPPLFVQAAFCADPYQAICGNAEIEQYHKAVHANFEAFKSKAGDFEALKKLKKKNRKAWRKAHDAYLAEVENLILTSMGESREALRIYFERVRATLTAAIDKQALPAVTRVKL